MTVTVYGIPNCDTVKKARTWLDGAGIAYVFHDYKKAGADAGQLAAWCATAGWEKVLNRAGTTFRKLPDADKAELDAAKAKALMLDQPAMIRRPLVDADGAYSVGFSADDWQQRFAA